jgi:hypothetical protein
VKVAVATCAALPPGFDDDRRLIAALAERGAEAAHAVWDDPAVRWERFDRVVLRTTWDYPRKHEAFLAWIDSVDGRLQNPARLVRWNSDKRYMADLAEAGIPAMRTRFVEPGDELPPLEGEIVVKPTVSVGGRLTGRFSPPTYDEARRLVRRLHEEGRVAMIQPYASAVDWAGETALVFIAGRFSHAAHKLPVLRPDEVAPMREDEIGGAEVMYGPDIVGPGTAREEQVDVGRAAIDFLRARFGRDPLYARVDMVDGPDGEPVVLELEAVEPNLFLAMSPGAAGRLADALLGP